MEFGTLSTASTKYLVRPFLRIFIVFVHRFGHFLTGVLLNVFHDAGSRSASIDTRKLAILYK
jgi:hypothetical protein